MEHGATRLSGSGIVRRELGAGTTIGNVRLDDRSAGGRAGDRATQGFRDGGLPSAEIDESELETPTPKKETDRYGF